MTKIIYSVAQDEGFCMDAEPFTVKVEDEYWDFAEFHLNYLRAEKPNLVNALLISGEMGAYLNLLGKLNAELKLLYWEQKTDYYLNNDDWSFMTEKNRLELAEEEAQEKSDYSFFYKEE